MTGADEVARRAEEIRAEFDDENLEVLNEVYQAFLAKVDLRALLAWKLPDGMDALMLPIFRGALLAITKDLGLGEYGAVLAEREQLLDDSRRLAALQAAGVDNWQGYDLAMSIYREGSQP